MRVFFDTNILLSAYYFRGKEREALQRIIDGKHDGFISLLVIDEIRLIMENKFREEKTNIQTYIEKLLSILHLVEDTPAGLDSLDPSDDRILGAALMAKCDYLITGDKQLLKVKDFKNIVVISTRDFLEQ